ncbi:MAG: M16 family metallopeptidase [Prevotella sp.]
MHYNTHTLANGLRVIHLYSDDDVVYCGYAINAGTRHENRKEEGMAHFCEHATFKGTARRKSMQVTGAIEKVGGDINAFTNKEDTTYYVTILKEHLPRAVDVLTDMVFHSEYPEDELDKEIEVICDEIESYNDSPAELIYDDFENIIFKNHPLGHNILGTANRLRQYIADDVRNFADRYYKPDNAVFFAYGNVDFTRLIKMLERATVDFKHLGPRPLAAVKSMPSMSEGTDIVIDKHTHQAHVMIGNRAYGVGDKRRMPLYLLNNIIGGPAMNSRLSVELREKRGLVYSVDSSMVSYTDTGLWCIYFGCDADDVRLCRRIIRRELDKWMHKALSETRLNMAKRQIRGQIGIAFDNRESFALDMGKVFLHYGKAKDVTSLIDSIDKIEANDMLEVARQIFVPDAMTTLTFL